MPSFPTSVFSPSARSNGQVIDASHVNDVQDELVAIEDGFRNATAPLNSSRSTVAALSVTGGSTVDTLTAGASTLASLSVTGASTFASRPVEPPPDAAAVVLSSATNLTNNTTQAMIWNDENYEINSSMHSTSVNADRLTPQSTGIYAYVAGLKLSGAFGADTGCLTVTVEDSSGAIAESFASGGDIAVSVNVAGTKRFTALGSYLRVVGLVRDVSTHSVQIAISRFEMWKL